MFQLTAEQRMLKELVRNFCLKFIPIDKVRELDRNEEFPEEIIREMAKLGLLGVSFPEKYGGSGGSLEDMVVLLEELAYHAPAVAAAYLMCVVFGGRSILAYGSDHQKAEYLPQMIDGRIKFALSVTEPDAGSDIANVRTRAEKRDHAYVITGNKVFTTGAHVADYLLVLARTEAGQGRQGLTVFLVDAKSPGVEIHRLEKLGMRAVGTNEVYYNEVMVPADRILGEPGRGFYHLMHTFQEERLMAAAIAVGYAQRAVDDALMYAKERRQFGRPIGGFQVIQHYLVDMQTRVDAARLLTYRAAYLQANGQDAIKETAMAKYYAAETLTFVANKQVQIFGGNGYMMEYDAQRVWRDAKFWEIAGGTTEIQKNAVATQMGLPRC